MKDRANTIMKTVDRPMMLEGDESPVYVKQYIVGTLNSLRMLAHQQRTQNEYV